MTDRKSAFDSVKDIFLDSNFIVSLVKTNDPHHKTAFSYLRFLKENKKRMLTSTICLSEYSVKSDASLLSRDLAILPFGIPDAHLAGKFRALQINAAMKTKGEEQRCFIKDDIKILAQANNIRVPIILSADQKFKKMADFFKTKGYLPHTEVIDFSQDNALSQTFAMLPGLLTDL